jgi:ribosome-binding protein aMBF1 (putative translation factor)
MLATRERRNGRDENQRALRTKIDMCYKNNIGPQVRRQRYALGWSQSILAAKLQIAGFDISRSGVSKIEARLS